MKKQLLIFGIIVLSSSSTVSAEDIQQPFPKGELNPYNEYFTGNTYLSKLSTNDDVWNSSIANVTFEPGARTDWHKHSGGQILLVTSGEGFYQEKGKPVKNLKAGDVVKIPIDVEHWHGAAPNNWFSHISVETNLPNNNTTWLEPVTDEEYNGKQILPQQEITGDTNDSTRQN